MPIDTCPRCKSRIREGVHVCFQYGMNAPISFPGSAPAEAPTTNALDGRCLQCGRAGCEGTHAAPGPQADPLAFVGKGATLPPALAAGAVELPSNKPAAVILPTNKAPCLKCRADVSYFDPPIVEGEEIACGPCARELFKAHAPPEGADYLRVKELAPDAITRLICDRFAKRYGRAPSERARAAYRARLAQWPLNLMHKLEEVRDHLIWFRENHQRAWGLKFLVQPKDDLAALQAIGNDISTSVCREEAEKN